MNTYALHKLKNVINHPYANNISKSGPWDQETVIF